MVFPLILLSSNNRTLLIEFTGAGHFIVFLVSLAAAVFDLYEYIVTKSSIMPLITTKSVMISNVLLVCGLCMFITSLLHLWSWIYTKDQLLRHTRWKPSAVLEGAYIGAVATIITFMCIALHGFYWFKFKQSLTHGMFQAMIKSNESAQLMTHLHKIQTDYACCGITSLSDYFNASEIKISNVVNPFNGASWNGCTSESCYIPFSCCRPEIHDCTPWGPILRDKFNLIDGEFIDQMYHQTGCVSIVGARHGGPAPFILLSCLFLIQFIVVGLTMLVSTATFVIEKVGAEEDNTVPSWILPICGASPNAIVEHTYRCFVAGKEFDRSSLAEAVLRDRERLKQRTAMLHQIHRDNLRSGMKTYHHPVSASTASIKAD